MNSHERIKRWQKINRGKYLLPHKHTGIYQVLFEPLFVCVAKERRTSQYNKLTYVCMYIVSVYIKVMLFFFAAIFKPVAYCAVMRTA